MTKYLGRLLIVEDDAQAAAFWRVAMEQAGFRVDTVTDLKGMVESIKSYSIDLMLLDLNLQDESGLEGLPLALSESPFTKIFILTANAAVDSAVEAIQAGASGYFTKDTDPEEVAEKLKAHLKSESTTTGGTSAEAFREAGLIGQGQHFQNLCQTIDQVKDVDSTIVILGESGTGKEVVARALHSVSGRSKGQFAAVNCAAIPEPLLESELFGHKKGAFTDAKSDRKGIFELCSEGTLLLDEIGDMPLGLQVKLLRVLQERQVVPVGGSTPISVNTRVLAATHRNLEEEVQAGRFRQDLLFRLSVVPIEIPPLRRRRDDIPILTEFFLKQLNERFKKSIAPPAPEVIQRLKSYDWPGNIRELKNAIERAVVLATSNELSLDHLFLHIKKPLDGSKSNKPSEVDSQHLMELFLMPLTDAKQAFEREYVTHLLTEAKGNIAESARRCGRYRVDMYRLMEKYGLNVDDYR
jgi:DNA-binding NtrC family response regulator